MRRALLALIVLVAAIRAASGEQRPVAPARDNQARSQQPAPSRETTGSIRGHVVALDGGRPLPKARVSLSSDNGHVETPLYTDALGEFTFGLLPFGHYTLLVEKTGFARLRYGARTELDPPVEIAIEAGSPMDDLLVGLIKGGAIIGRVTDDFGDPIVGGEVSIGAVQAVGASLRLVPVTRPAVMTNDLGDYRIGDLPAGRYYVNVAGAGLGTVPLGTPREWERLSAWGRTFFPAAPGAALATAVLLRAGEERSGVDIAVQPFARTQLALSVGGLVSSRDFAGAALSNGAPTLPLQAQLRLSFIPDEDLDSGQNVRTISLAGFGTSTVPLPNMPVQEPGDWLVLARQGTRGALERVHLLNGENATANVELKPTSRVSGRVVFEGTHAVPPATAVQVSAHGAGPDRAVPARLLAAPVAAKADGTFQFPELLGSVELQATAPGGWALKSVLYGGQDLLDTPLVLKGGEDISGVQVVFSDQVSGLSGLVLAADGNPAAGCTVALFPEEAFSRFNPRRMRLARADRYGRFRIGDVPSGAYRAAAMFDIDAASWLSDDSIARLRARSTPMPLAARAPEVTTLSCLGAP